MLLTAIFSSSVFASIKAIETEIMVACIYNFARFTSWSDNDSDTGLVKIAFTGDGIVQTSMNILNGKKLDDKTILVKKLAVESPEDCLIVFISSAEAASTKEILALYEKKPVLTISDQPGFIANGGMIELFFLNNRIRFKINNRKAQNAGIQISSQVLNLASEVIK